jgi:trans-aconitate methyltransferase
MATAKLVPSYERFLDRVVETMTPEEILAFKVPDEEQRRAEELLDKNNEGELTVEERAELEQMLEFEELMMLLKIRAESVLQKS